MKEGEPDYKKGLKDTLSAREAEVKRRQLERCFRFLEGPKRLPPSAPPRTYSHTYTEEELLAELECPG